MASQVIAIAISIFAGLGFWILCLFVIREKVHFGKDLVVNIPPESKFILSNTVTVQITGGGDLVLLNPTDNTLIREVPDNGDYLTLRAGEWRLYDGHITLHYKEPLPIEIRVKSIHQGSVLFVITVLVVTYVPAVYGLSRLLQ